MFIIIIAVFFSGVYHAQGKWSERYQTMAECKNAISLVSLQMNHEEGVTFEFDCVSEERGA